MRIFRSIRWRFQLWLAFLLIAILSGFGVSAYQLHRQNRLGLIDEELERRVSALNSDVRGRPPAGDHTARGRSGGPGFPPPRRFGPEHDSDSREARPEPPWEPRNLQLSSRSLLLFDETDTNGFYFVIWTRDGTRLQQSANAPTEIVSPSRVNAGTRIHRRMNLPNREAFQLTEFGLCVLVGRPIASDLKALERFAWWLVAAGGAVLAIGLGGGWRLANGALRPVALISTTASRISAGNLAERIDVADTDSELGRLATVLNSTFARLETAFAQQRQFTADASHELRTPLTVMISEAQTTLARERTAAEYRETVQACLDTAQRMRKLTQSLLELARFDAGQQRMESGAFDLAQRVRACVELIEPMARRRHLRLDSDLAPTEVVGDPDRLSQVVVNLLTNAVQYNHDHGRIRVTTRVDADAAILTVTNTGPGISDDDLPHVFERFYRADKARGSAEGRHGLGLSICRAIVQAHCGSVSVASQLGADTTFTVRLPRFAPSRINWETTG